MRRALRIAGYTGWFTGAFLVGILLTFPVEDLKGFVQKEVENALGKGKQGAYGVDPRVEIGSLGLSGFGVRAERVQVQLASRDPDPGPTIDVDSLRVGVVPWTLLGETRAVTFAADLYGGSIRGKVRATPKGQLHGLALHVEKLDLAKIPLAQAHLGIPLAGQLALHTDLTLGKAADKEAQGAIELSLKGLTVGPGNLKAAAAFGGFELPAVDGGNLEGKVTVDKGRGLVEGLQLKGRDFEAELKGEIAFKPNVAASRLDLDGWFQPAPSFLEREQKFKTLLELGESLGPASGLARAKDESGRYWFAARGALQSPNVALARDKGKRGKGRATKEAPPPEAPAGEVPG